MSREEKFMENWRKINLVMKHKPEIFFNGHKSLTFKWYYSMSQGPNPMHLHFSMFTECIKRLASKEQKKKWLQPANNLNIIGGYIQTELGHGSNVAGLETTATLDKKTDEFVIHTPTIKATKFWPGTIGLQATHGVVFARLIVDENDYGVQPFMVQIRSLKDHMPMPGIEVGDVGEKFGYDMMDNAYVSFNKVRIPRTDMFSRFAEVDKEGNFSLNGDPRMVYQIMVQTRLLIIFGANYMLLHSCRIATRYAVCRRQFRTIEGKQEERQIIDY